MRWACSRPRGTARPAWALDGPYCGLAISVSASQTGKRVQQENGGSGVRDGALCRPSNPGWEVRGLEASALPAPPHGGKWARVRVDLRAEYATPPSCVACAAPASRKSLPAYATSWDNKHSLTVHFPLCDECYAAYQVDVEQGRKAGMLSLSAGIITLLVAAFLGVECWTSGIVTIVSAMTVVWLGRQALLTAQSRHMRARIRQVRDSAKVDSLRVAKVGAEGVVSFRFASSDYASVFGQMNQGSLT